MSYGWNPWHGCRKFSSGCLNCYVYRIDAAHGKDASVITRTADFDLPLRRGRDKTYKIESGALVYTCFSSDFLLEEADAWRAEAWAMMRARSDVDFLFITKRIHRLEKCLPADWGAGYDNVILCCTVEDQAAADARLPIYIEAPLRHRMICCEPLLGPIDLSARLGPWIEGVHVGGESGPDARVCDFEWVKDLRRQCDEKGVPFLFRQTGARLKKDGRVYRIPRKDQFIQAARAGLDTMPRRREEWD